jgi:hypothetical protein
VLYLLYDLFQYFFVKKPTTVQGQDSTNWKDYDWSLDDDEFMNDSLAKTDTKKLTDQEFMAKLKALLDKSKKDKDAESRDSIDQETE